MVLRGKEKNKLKDPRKSWSKYSSGKTTQKNVTFSPDAWEIIKTIPKGMVSEFVSRSVLQAHLLSDKDDL